MFRARAAALLSFRKKCFLGGSLTAAAKAVGIDRLNRSGKPLRHSNQMNIEFFRKRCCAGCERW